MIYGTKYGKDLFCVSAIVDIQIDRLGKIQAEDSHDGFLRR